MCCVDQLRSQYETEVHKLILNDRLRDNCMYQHEHVQLNAIFSVYLSIRAIQVNPSLLKAWSGPDLGVPRKKETGLISFY